MWMQVIDMRRKMMYISFVSSSEPHSLQRINKAPQGVFVFMIYFVLAASRESISYWRRMLLDIQLIRRKADVVRFHCSPPLKALSIKGVF